MNDLQIYKNALEFKSFKLGKTGRSFPITNVVVCKRRNTCKSYPVIKHLGKNLGCGGFFVVICVSFPGRSLSENYQKWCGFFLNLSKETIK